MKSIKDKVYETGRMEIKTGGFGGKLEIVEEFMDRKNFKAKTNFKTRQIYFGYDPRVIKSVGENVLLRVSSDAVSHEINHHQYKGCIGCPQTIEKDYELFFTPMYEILSKKGFSKEDANYATNALQDTILHRDLKSNVKKFLDGIVFFFKDQAKEGFTDFYEAHVKLNMDLWGEKKQRKKLSGFYKNNEKVKDVLSSFYSELNDGKFKINVDMYERSSCKIKKGFFGKIKRKWIDRKDRSIESFDKVAIQRYFLEEGNWKEISRAYAEYFSKLMTPNYAMSTIDHSGAGTKGKEDEDSSKEGNVFKKERESRGFKKVKVSRASAKGEKVPKWIDSMEALDIYYENLAEQIVIKAESYVNSESFPITRYGQRDFDYENDNFRNVSFGFDNNGGTVLKKKKYSYDIPISVKVSPKSFPKIKFGMIDISGSMKEDIDGGYNIGNTSIIPWGDNSKYHWALMTQFGIFEYFKRNHLLTQNSISALTFGAKTRIIEGYRNVKDCLLKPNFEGSTNINLSKASNFFMGEGNLIYTIGDGEIQNWSKIRDNFIEMAKRHSYVHLHMGIKNDMINDLRKANLEVIVAEDGMGIVNKVINLTNRIIRN